jgi:hypothetical protein
LAYHTCSIVGTGCIGEATFQSHLFQARLMAAIDNASPNDEAEIVDAPKKDCTA